MRRDNLNWLIIDIYLWPSNGDEPFVCLFSLIFMQTLIELSEHSREVLL